jgi:hypothetical protein
VKKMARPEVRMFRYSSRPITLSVSQLVYLGSESTLCTKEETSEEDGEARCQNVLVQLPSDHLVRLPVSVPRVREYIVYKLEGQ